MQLENPDFEKVPAGHVEQEDKFVLGYVPAGHIEHSEDFSLLIYPKGHA